MQQEEKTVPAEKSSSVSLTGSLARLKAKTAVQASPAAETEEKSEDIATEAKVTRKRSGAKAKAEVAPEAVPETEVKEEKPRRKRSTAKGAETEKGTAAAGDSAAEKAKAALGNVKENVSAAIENFNLKEKLSGLKEKAGDLQQQIKEKPKKFMIIAGIALAVVVGAIYIISAVSGLKERAAIQEKIHSDFNIFDQVLSLKITERQEVEKRKKTKIDEVAEGIFGKDVLKEIRDFGPVAEVQFTAKVRLAAPLYVCADKSTISYLPAELTNLVTTRVMQQYLNRIHGMIKPVYKKGEIITITGRAEIFENSATKEKKTHISALISRISIGEKHLYLNRGPRLRMNYGPFEDMLDGITDYAGVNSYYDTEKDVMISGYLPEGSDAYNRLLDRFKSHHNRKAELEKTIREKNSQISAAETKVRDAENSKKVKFERMHREAVAEVNRILNEEFGENKFERNEAEMKTLQRKCETLRFESAGASRAVSSRRAAIAKLQAEIDEFGGNLIYENRIKKRKDQIRELEAGIGKLVEASEKASAALRECQTRLAALEEENRRIHNRKYQLDNEKVKTVRVPAEYNTAISDAKKELEKLKSELSSAQRELNALDFRI